MKRTTLCGLFLFMLSLFPFGIVAADYMAEADELFEQGGLANFKQAIELYQKAIDENPGSYEANWKKSLKYYREYQATEYFTDNMKAHVYIGELLIQMGGNKNKTEAKGYLENATQSDDPYFRDKAMELLVKLK